MSDNLTRYCIIRKGLRQLCHREPKGRFAQHLNTLAHFVSGIVASGKCQTSAIASKVPDGTKRQSRIRRYERFLANDTIAPKTYFLPYVHTLLTRLPAGALVLVMDASEVGRGCMALVVSVVYKKRALPLCWLVVTGSKGHLGDALHQKLFAEVKALLPPEREVVFLGDGEFNGGGLLQAVEAQDWHFVCRLPKNTLVREAGAEVRYSLSWLGIERGHVCELPEVCFTQQDIGPVTIVLAWHQAYDAPLYLVTNLELWQEAYRYYRQRFRIETFFSDQKSRGFFLCRSHLSDPKRLERLMLATCLAYLWMVCLGAAVVENGKLPLLHRTHRCDLSLFQIGLLWMEHCLNQDLPLPFLLSPRRAVKYFKSVG